MLILLGLLMKKFLAPPLVDQSNEVENDNKNEDTNNGDIPPKEF